MVVENLLYYCVGALVYMGFVANMANI